MSIRVRTSIVLATVVPLVLAARPAAAQDLGMVEALFDEVSAVTVFYQSGWVPSSDEISSDGAVHGAGSEVLVSLASSGRMTYELGLGASYLRGYLATEPTLDLRATLRALPTVALYATRDSLFGRVSAYAGGTFGLVELWNAQAYGPSGQPWDVEARTFELGGSVGLYLNSGFLRGLFAEAGYRFREFHSVKWTSSADEELPAAWPRSLDFSGPVASLGWQLQLGGAKEEAEEEPAPAPPLSGTWVAETLDARALPAVWDPSGWRLTTAFLSLVPDSAGAAEGTYELQMFLAGDGPTPERRVERGGYAAEDGGLRLRPESGRPAHTARRLNGRLYLAYADARVLVFAPAADR